MWYSLDYISRQLLILYLNLSSMLGIQIWNIFEASPIAKEEKDFKISTEKHINKYVELEKRQMW